MIKRILMLALAIMTVGFARAQGRFVPESAPLPDASPIPVEALPQARAAAWEDWRKAQLESARLIEETGKRAMTFGEATMRYTVEVVGEKPEDGYPLYIALHGGGSGETPDLNDAQWAEMQFYYSMALDCGVYVAVRGVRDTWDTHFNPESYPLYDRLIQYMILTEAVDPNRVYLEGFSAGGDGVYAISARMPDRFAAVNMSSGHPNGISPVNLFNLPIQLQAGEYDTDYDRNTTTAEYGLQLDALRAEYGGFEHRTLIHFDRGHNYEDYDREPVAVMADAGKWLREGDRAVARVDSFPPDYMDAFTRDPLPPTLIWDLSTRASSRETESFYYLSAPFDTDQGVVKIRLEGGNRISVDTRDVNGPFSIMLNEAMVDFSKPVVFTVDGVDTALTLAPDRAILDATTRDRGDPWYQFEAVVEFKYIA